MRKGPMSFNEPSDIETDEIDDHRQKSVRIKQDETGPDCKALTYRASHIDVTSPFANGEIAVQSGYRNECSMNAQQGKYQTAFFPLLSSGK